MKRFEKYLDSLAISSVIRKRIEEIFEFYQQVSPEGITDVFITNHTKTDDSEHFDNLWFFSENYIMEAKQFITEDDFDLMILKNRVLHSVIKKKNYNFKKADNESRMMLEVLFSGSLQAEFKASKRNCDYLREIFMKHIKPNVVSVHS